FLGIFIAALLPLFFKEVGFPLRYALAFVFLSGNWMISFVPGLQSPMALLWSVSFEEQFYLLWPALISKLSRPQTLLRAAGAMILISTIGRIILLPYAQSLQAPVTIFTNSITRLDPLAAGIATAVLLHNKCFFPSRTVRFFLLAAGIFTWLLAGH